MITELAVYYCGWGERWHWGTLRLIDSFFNRPEIVFEYSDEATSRGVELSALRLPVDGPKLRRNFLTHQLGLPGPVYDSLPDGWGLLLMDRYFKRKGRNPVEVSPLERLTFVGDDAMGAMCYVPQSEDLQLLHEEISLDALSAQVQPIIEDTEDAVLTQFLQLGGSPQGARPKALLYRSIDGKTFRTAYAPGFGGWIVKFQAANEHSEVSAIEALYAQLMRKCKIEVSEFEYFKLKNDATAFGMKRFDRTDNNLRIPMQSLASFTGADFRTSGSLDYAQFLRATWACTRNAEEWLRAFKQIVFNVVFNNRDDHPKNFSYLMSADGHWSLSPAYDVTFSEGPAGYHQMDVMGEALHISKKSLLDLALHEAQFDSDVAFAVIDRTTEVALQFMQHANTYYQGEIRPATLREIQKRIDENLKALG